MFTEPPQQVTSMYIDDMELADEIEHGKALIMSMQCFIISFTMFTEPPQQVTSMFIDDTPVELADVIEHGKALIMYM